MITIPAGVRVYLALGATDRRKGFDGLLLLAQEVLREDPFSGHLFVFRGKRGDLIRCCIGTAKVSACSPSGWSGAGSSGRRPGRARWR